MQTSDQSTVFNRATRSKNTQKTKPPLHVARSLMLGFTALLIAGAGSLLWGSGTASAQNAAPTTPSNCSVSQISSGYQIVVSGMDPSADRIHIRNNGSNRDLDGRWMGRRYLAGPSARAIIERPDLNRTGVQHFSVRALNGTVGSGYRYCGSITFPSINCSVVANADGSNTITWRGGGGDMVLRNGAVVASTVETGFGRWVDSNDAFNVVPTRQDLIPGQRYHYSVDSVLDTSPKFYCGSVIARGSTTTQPLPTSNCFADDTPGQGIDVSWSRTTSSDAPTNADRYVIERRRNGGTWFWAARVEAADLVDGEVPEWRDVGKSRTQTLDRFDYRVISQRNGVNSAPRLCGNEGG